MEMDEKPSQIFQNNLLSLVLISLNFFKNEACRLLKNDIKKMNVF